MIRRGDTAAIHLQPNWTELTLRAGNSARPTHPTCQFRIRPRLSHGKAIRDDGGETLGVVEMGQVGDGQETPKGTAGKQIKGDVGGRTVGVENFRRLVAVNLAAKFARSEEFDASGVGRDGTKRRLLIG